MFLQDFFPGGIFFAQESEGGIYGLIGERLRQHPELSLTSDLDGPAAVINGSFVHLNVVYNSHTANK